MGAGHNSLTKLIQPESPLFNIQSTVVSVVTCTCLKKVKCVNFIKLHIKIFAFIFGSLGPFWPFLDSLINVIFLSELRMKLKTVEFKRE